MWVGPPLPALEARLPFRPSPRAVPMPCLRQLLMLRLLPRTQLPRQMPRNPRAQALRQRPPIPARNHEQEEEWITEDYSLLIFSSSFVSASTSRNLADTACCP